MESPVSAYGPIQSNSSESTAFQVHQSSRSMPMRDSPARIWQTVSYEGVYKGLSRLVVPFNWVSTTGGLPRENQRKMMTDSPTRSA